MAETNGAPAAHQIRDWFAGMLAFQERAILVATHNQRLKDDTHMAQGNPKCTTFEVDSLVLISYPKGSYGRAPPTRFTPPQRGPFIVKEIRGNKIIVEGINDGVQEEHLILNARPFIYNPARVDPTKVALTDRDLYIVERIISHKGDPKMKKQLSFKVKWVGYEEPSMEPYSALRDNEKLHEYLSKKKTLRALIPAKYRKTIDKDA